MSKSVHNEENWIGGWPHYFSPPRAKNSLGTRLWERGYFLHANAKQPVRQIKTRFPLPHWSVRRLAAGWTGRDEAVGGCRAFDGTRSIDTRNLWYALSCVLIKVVCKQLLEYCSIVLHAVQLYCSCFISPITLTKYSLDCASKRVVCPLPY